MSDSNWQPIESAPKGNCELVLLNTAAGMIEGYFRYGDWQQDICECTYDGAGGVVIGCKPTHWMPLPEPPNQTQSQTAKE